MKAAACPWFDALSDKERSVAREQESGTSDLSQAHGRAAHRDHLIRSGRFPLAFWHGLAGNSFCAYVLSVICLSVFIVLARIEVPDSQPSASTEELIVNEASELLASDDASLREVDGLAEMASLMFDMM